MNCALKTGMEGVIILLEVWSVAIAKYVSVHQKYAFLPLVPKRYLFLFLKHQIEPIVFPGSPALSRTRTT
jgi:hypothetical protein